jgi:hypothetical protein
MEDGGLNVVPKAWYAGVMDATQTDDLIKYGIDLNGHTRRGVLWTLPDGSVMHALRCDHGDACQWNDPKPRGAHETTEAEKAEIAARYAR